MKPFDYFPISPVSPNRFYLYKNSSLIYSRNIDILDVNAVLLPRDSCDCPHVLLRKILFIYLAEPFAVAIQLQCLKVIKDIQPEYKSHKEAIVKYNSKNAFESSKIIKITL